MKTEIDWKEFLEVFHSDEMRQQEIKMNNLYTRFHLLEKRIRRTNDQKTVAMYLKAKEEYNRYENEKEMIFREDMEMMRNGQ